MKKRRIAVVYSTVSSQVDGRYTAAETDTAVSAEMVADALRSDCTAVQLIPVAPGDTSSLSGIRADAVFDLIEWTGNDLPYAVAALRALEKLGIPVTGADHRNYRLTTEKHAMKAAFRRHAVPTPAWQVFLNGTEEFDTGLQYPLLIKASSEHCGIGLSPDSLVTTETAARRQIRRLIRKFSQPVVAEEYIDGREFEVTVLGNGDGARVLPVSETTFAADQETRFLTFESRWDPAYHSFVRYSVAPARLTPTLRTRIGSTVLRGYAGLGFRDYARFDLRVRGTEDVFVLEANSNPGLDDDPENGLVVAFRSAGFTFRSFVRTILQECLTRTGTPLMPASWVRNA